jgi:predicted P-loop ATPase
VRLHKFAQLDDEAKINTPTNKLPSFKKMMDFVSSDDAVKLNLYREQVLEAQKDFAIDDAAPQEDDKWAMELKSDDKNGYLNSIDNLVIILENDRLLKNKFGYNEFTYRFVVTGELYWSKDYPRDWSDSDEANLRHYMEKVYGIRGKDNIKDAVTITALKNRFHPVREYLESVVWDGTKRLETLFCDYLGADKSDYVKFVTRKTLVAAVARIFHPGIKFDNVLTLVGRQGCGKSQIIKRLAGDWFSDSLTTVQGKEAFEQIQGFWLIEMPELSALRKAETEAIKAFTAKAEDSYRAPYERYAVTRKRQCIFLGTTNRYEFLKDPTGNRRFWPIDVHPSRAAKNMWEELDETEVGQIWAEAVTLYNRGESVYIDKAELKTIVEEEQEKHFDVDPMANSIINYLDMLLPENWKDMEIYDRRNFLNGGSDFGSIPVKGTVRRDKVCVMEIWCELYGRDKSECRQADSRAIKDVIMKTGEWEMSKTSIRFGKPYGTQRGFIRKNNEALSTS